MSVLVIAEHDNKALRSSTLSAVTAASQLSDDISVLVAGAQCDTVVEQCRAVGGVRRVVACDAVQYEHGLAENMAPLIVEMAAEFTHILAPATTWGKNCLPRVAALLDVAQISDVCAIESADTFVRPIYAGNAFATVRSKSRIKVLSIRTTAFAEATIDDAPNASVEAGTALPDAGLSQFVSAQLTASERPELAAAKCVVSGGRGLQSEENFKLIDELADALGAAVGASRAAVDAGYVPNDYQVGQTGKVVAPALYIAVGISGAIQHIAGMRDSQIIVAINKDEEAPIFQLADYGLVGDLFTILPELTQAIRDKKG